MHQRQLILFKALSSPDNAFLKSLDAINHSSVYDICMKNAWDSSFEHVAVSADLPFIPHLHCTTNPDVSEAYTSAAHLSRAPVPACSAPVNAWTARYRRTGGAQVRLYLALV